jgi:hypothetical protein
MSVAPLTSRPTVLLVDGEPMAGFELPRHAVPTRFVPRRVLATDLKAMREAIRAGVAAVVIDGRESPLAALVLVEEVRASARSGARVPIVVVVASLAAAVVLEQAPEIHIVTLPVDPRELHDMLVTLTGPPTSSTRDL